MNLSTEFSPIREWAEAKGIIGPNGSGDPKTQTVKLMEEAGELAKAVLKKDTEEIKDAIGDIAVVLTSVAHFHGLTIEECINSAYQVIKNRKGGMQDGNFVKS